jgi:hypothetical protein
MSVFGRFADKKHRLDSASSWSAADAGSCSGGDDIEESVRGGELWRPAGIEEQFAGGDFAPRPLLIISADPIAFLRSGG